MTFDFNVFESINLKKFHCSEEPCTFCPAMPDSFLQCQI